MKMNTNAIRPIPEDASGTQGGGGGTNQDELKGAIEAARLDERKKLSDQVTQLTASLEALKGQVATISAEKTAAENAILELKTTHEALKSSMSVEGKLDVEKAISSAVGSALSRQGPVLQGEIEKLRLALEAETKKREAAELAQARALIIEEMGGNKVLIPELVSGNTVEELKASAERSKGIMTRTLEAAGGVGGGGSTANNSGIPSIPFGGSVSGGASSSSLATKRLTNAEWQAQKHQLKAAALSQLRTGQ